jgi:hypothetical protein
MALAEMRPGWNTQMLFNGRMTLQPVRAKWI